MRKFLDEDFLLYTETSRRLYHEHARDMPIIDYHNHLPPDEIAQDKRFPDITSIWLNGDHYK
ncbi:MAG: glucuronate isomerase, partial [Chitinophagia bacterium]|nr:glucuronate isomerase [Chitinophagia bacterium]